MSHSAAKRDWPRAIFEALLFGMLIGGLIEMVIPGASEDDRAVGAILVAVVLTAMWKLLALQLDRIESKLSN